MFCETLAFIPRKRLRQPNRVAEPILLLLAIPFRELQTNIIFLILRKINIYLLLRILVYCRWHSTNVQKLQNTTIKVRIFMAVIAFIFYQFKLIIIIIITYILFNERTADIMTWCYIITQHLNIILALPLWVYTVATPWLYSKWRPCTDV